MKQILIKFFDQNRLDFGGDPHYALDPGIFKGCM